MTDSHRYKKAEFAARIGIAGNLALALLKGIIGYAAGSKALLADSLHTASEAAASLAGGAGHRELKVQPSRIPGNPELTKAIVLSTIWLVLGLEIGLSSVKSIVYGVTAPPAKAAFIAVILSIVLKEALFRALYRNRDMASSGSSAERRSGIYSSLTALAGTGGAMLGDYLHMPFLYYLDPIAGAVVSLLVLRWGYRLISESIHSPANRPLHQKESDDLLDTVQRIKGVIAVDELRAREQGHYVIVDIKLSVNPRISVQDGHDIAKTVKQTLMKRFTHVSDVFIHVHPYDPGYPYKSEDPEHDDLPTVLH